MIRLDLYYSLYDFLASVVPGLWGGVSIYFWFRFASPSVLKNLSFVGLNSMVQVFLFIFCAFFIGHALHTFGNIAEHLVYKWKWRMKPGAAFLSPENQHFSSEFKDILNEQIQEILMVSPKNKDAFRLCYFFVMQKGLATHVIRFRALQGFYRESMTVAMMNTAASIVLFAFGLHTPPVWKFGLGNLILAVLLCCRYIRFSEYYADAVLRTFYLYNIKRENT